MASLTQLLFSNKEEDHEAFVEKLRSIVIGELRERNLFNVSPKYLGYAGGSWQDGDGDRINDLVMDIYEAILRRRTTLRTHLKNRPDLDGMIRRNVRNFFHDRQHQHDPIGFGVFHN